MHCKLIVACKRSASVLHVGWQWFPAVMVCRSVPSHLGWIARRVAPWIGRTPAQVGAPGPVVLQALTSATGVHVAVAQTAHTCLYFEWVAGSGCCRTLCYSNVDVAAVVLQGAEVAVYAATSPSFTADTSVPLLLHDCKPMTPSVSVGTMCGAVQAGACLFRPSGNLCPAVVLDSSPGSPH